MAPQRTGSTPVPSSLSPQDSATSSSPSSPSNNNPRSTSPSGFAQFLSKSSRWFGRSSSHPKLAAPPTMDAPRTSTSNSSVSSSTGRKHKISRPTHPRPIGGIQAVDSRVSIGSRSVLDLSRPQASTDTHFDNFGSSGTSLLHQNVFDHSSALGDLRAVSKKGWSRSADDLGKLSESPSSTMQPSFQEKIFEYRNRSGSNASGAGSSTGSSPVLLTSSSSKNVVFPTFGSGTTDVGGNVENNNTHGVSISISGPVSDDAQTQTHTVSHAHTRSHSFTPRLPSKLAGLNPPSPYRKGASGSEKDADRSDGDVDKLTNPPFSGRAGFPFGLGAGGMKGEVPSGARTTAFLLSPPANIDPSKDTLDVIPSAQSSKRSSQIVYQSGFVNRFTPSSPSTTHAAGYSGLSSSKAWKAFKCELKGNKLVFWKVPGDRTAGVKDLFATELVPAEADDDASLQEGLDGTPENGGEADWEGSKPGRGTVSGREDVVGGGGMRKKRTFWGRRAHPELIKDPSGEILRGTLEALLHETVFATSFSNGGDMLLEEEIIISAGDEESEDEDAMSDAQRERKRRREDATERARRWKDFASGILIGLPLLTSRGRVETEFLRCCSYLISGSSETQRETDRKRVGWLADEYVRVHGSPVDSTAWEEWRVDCISGEGGALTNASGGAHNEGLSTSASTQALYSPSPNPGLGSPNLATFSPRPGDTGGMLSLMEVLNAPVQKPSTPPRSGTMGTSETRQTPWIALEREGLSRDVLLALDPKVIAKSLGVFHRGVVGGAPENLTAEMVFEEPEGEGVAGGVSLSPLFGNNDRPHWLTKLLLMQILGADTSSGNLHSLSSFSPSYLSSPTRTSSEPRLTHTSRTHSRSELISVWAKVGELCRMAGDECSWRAIAEALCSRPVARLDKVWKRVDGQAISAVEAWVYPGVGEDCIGVKEPRFTAWGGDVRARGKEELTKALVGGGDEEVWAVDSLERVRTLFEGFRTAFSLCPRGKGLGAAGQEEISEETWKLVTYWKEMSEGGMSGGLAAKFLQIDQFMSLSLAAEPRKKGLFEPYFWSKPSSIVTARNSLMPLLFPEPLPSLSLIDRNLLLRGRVDSENAEFQFLRSGRPGLVSHRSASSVERPSFSKTIGMEHTGTVIPLFDGNLVLVVAPHAESGPQSRAPSRPPSSVVDHGTAEKSLTRNPSVRVKPGASLGLERKPSTSRRNSLPSLSQRQNFATAEQSLERPLGVMVRAGTLNCLVQILLHGLQGVSVSFSDDNGEMSLREGKTRDLYVDHGEFAGVWWNVFRSFVTPLVFFELIRKNYLSAQPKGSSPTSSEYLAVIRTRTEILETVREWVCSGGGSQDVLDDTHLYNLVTSFLDNEDDHNIVKTDVFEDATVRTSWSGLIQLRKSISITFHSQARRPPRSVVAQRRPANTQRSKNVRKEPPDVDNISAEDLVENLDEMACAAFGNVGEEDLFVTADLLEVQTSDRTGWFSSKEPTVNEEAIEIQTIYSHVLEVESSSLISELTQDAFYRFLPPGIRSCVRAYTILTKWLTSKLVASRLGLRTRQARMELFLQAIEIARLRSESAGTSDINISDQPCRRSFVESVLTSAVISAESRLHQRAWQNVAANRGAQYDTLSALMFQPTVDYITSKDVLTVDIGWLMERMLEVIASPDTVDQTSQDHQEQLVNFCKRRSLCNLIASVPSISISRGQQRDESSRRSFERLNTIEKEVNKMTFDLRLIREDAQREAMAASVNGSLSARKVSRPFHRIIILQIEKNRRDKNLRERLIKEKRSEIQRIKTREDIVNKAMRPKKPVQDKNHRSKKSMSSAFMHFMRPISSAFSLDVVPQGTKKTPQELDFVASGKPSLVLSLADAKVARLINNERSFTFQLDTEDGGHYLLQAISNRDLTKWIDTINRIAKMAAKRRLTYLGNSPKPQLEDHLHTHSIVGSRDPFAVFGVDVEFLLRREADGADPVAGSIPRFVEQGLEEVENRGLMEVGIYRIAGAASEVNALKEALNRGEQPITPSTDIHAVCDLVKSWFRLLPEPVFPSSSYFEIIEAIKVENLEERLARIRDIIRGLPQANFDLVRRVSEHLDRVTDFEEQNQMTAEALAIVFSPNLLRAPHNDFVMILANMGHTHKLVKTLISHFHTIFDDDVDQEAEVDDEEEEDFASAIMEDEEAEIQDEHGRHVEELSSSRLVS